MAQIFPKWLNKLPLLLGIGAPVLILAATAFIWYYFSPKYTDVGYSPVQPVPYSHKLHAGDMRLSCFYCHAQAEVSKFATVPPTQVCMNCHRVVGVDKATLAPVRASAQNHRPIHWVRVHALPGYVYFDHSAHLKAGVGCSTCHGDVASMERIRQVEPLSMSWCLDCHRNPAPSLRSFDQLTNTTWTPPANQAEIGAKLVAERHIAPPVECSGCHR